MTLLQALPAVCILVALGAVLVTCPDWLPADRIPHDGWPFFGLGGGFILLGLLASAWMLHRFFYHEWYLYRALDRQPTELGVENRRLILRYASGRADVWPRERIENIVVEQRRVATGDNHDTTIFAYLCLLLRAGGKVNLYSPAPCGSFQEHHLHWMARELR